VFKLTVTVFRVLFRLYSVQVLGFCLHGSLSLCCTLGLQLRRFTHAESQLVARCSARLLGFQVFRVYNLV
jgi:hypothetical protein